jgi:hypothetical protein
MWKDVTRKDLNWKEKWNYLFGPPGWSHDGSRLTSDEMRAEEDGQLNTGLPPTLRQTAESYIPDR